MHVREAFRKGGSRFDNSYCGEKFEKIAEEKLSVQKGGEKKRTIRSKRHFHKVATVSTHFGDFKKIPTRETCHFAENISRNGSSIFTKSILNCSKR